MSPERRKNIMQMESLSEMKWFTQRKALRRPGGDGREWQEGPNQGQLTRIKSATY